MTDSSIKKIENRELWDSWRPTDVSSLKEVSLGGRKFLSLPPHQALEEATEMWGSYGDQWGLRHLHYDVLTLSERRKDSRGNYVDETRSSVVLTAEFFYPKKNGTEVAFPVQVDLPWRSGDDVFKKLRTQAQSKALSFLGLAKEVYFAEFDTVDARVQAERKQRKSSEKFANAINAIMVASTAAELDKCEEFLKRYEKEDKVITPSNAKTLQAMIDRKRGLLVESE